MLPAIGLELAALRGEPISGFNLTDDEVQLRTLAYGIVEPRRLSQRQDRLVAEFRLARLYPLGTGQADHRSYYAALREEPFASSEARFSALALDIRTDEDLTTPFFALARKIVMADASRIGTAQRLADLDGRELHDITARVEENRATIHWVRQVLLQRVEAYRFALERLAIETPSPRVHAAQVALKSFAVRLDNPLGLVDFGAGAAGAAGAGSVFKR